LVINAGDVECLAEADNSDKVQYGPARLKMKSAYDNEFTKGSTREVES